MRRLVVALVLVVAGLVAAPAGAAPSSPNCVTRWEVRQLAIGMDRADVYQLLDGPGRAGLGRTRNYRPCGRPAGRSQVQVSFGKADRLTMAVRISITKGGRLL